MAGIQGFSDATNTNTSSTLVYSAPPRRRTTTNGFTFTTRNETGRQQLTRYSQEQIQEHDQMWRKNEVSSLEQELERRNLQKLQFNENNTSGEGFTDGHEQEDEITKLNRSSLSKNSSSEDEGGEVVRPNKLFPVLSEQDELFRKVRSVLNKVSSVNYTRLRKRWLNLMPLGVDEDQGLEDSRGEARLSISQISQVLRMVLSKALDDTIYMHIYAGLLGYVIARKPADISSKIRSLINSQLQSELKKLTTDKELALFHRSTARVDLARRKKVALHRFIAELYCERACTSRFLYERVTDLLIVNNPADIDETVECLCVVMTFAGSKLEGVKKPWVEDIFTKLIHRQNETPQLVSKRISFMILDLVEMKGSGWSPHNKWWSPSVQRAPERERTQSSPSPRSPSARPANSQQPDMVPLQQQEVKVTGRKQPKKKTYRNYSPRSRTRSEGSGGSSNRNSATGGDRYPTPTSSKTSAVIPPPTKNVSVTSSSTAELGKTSRATAKPGEVQQTQQQQQHPQSGINVYVHS